MSLSGVRLIKHGQKLCNNNAYRGHDLGDHILDLEQELISSDPSRRWEAASALTDYAVTSPEKVWPIIVRQVSRDDEDLQEAIATCILEHVLEYHFNRFFELLEEEIAKNGNEKLRETLKLCWKLGQAETPENSVRWDRLVRGN